MARVIVSNLAERIVAALKQQAMRHGLTLGKKNLRDIVSSATKPSRTDALRIVKEIRQSAPRQRTDSTELIRLVRDRQ